MAVKSVLRSKLTKKLLENLESEIAILKGIQHAHIVQLLDCTKSAMYIHLVMEYCSLGDLSYFIKKRDKLHLIPAASVIPRHYPNNAVGGLNEVVVRHFLQQVGSALEFLRSRNLMHRDLKPQNLLLQEPLQHLQPHVGLAELPTLKIADFGFARSLPSTSLAETLCGSPLYMAPEILRYEKYDATADLWSIGAVTYEMVTGKPPFRAQNHVELLRKIERGDDQIKFPQDAEGTPFASDDLKGLIRSLLRKSPRDRLSYASFFSNTCLTTKLVSRVVLKQQDDRLPVHIPGAGQMDRSSYIKDYVSTGTSIPTESPLTNPLPMQPSSLPSQHFQYNPLTLIPHRPPMARQQSQPPSPPEDAVQTTVVRSATPTNVINPPRRMTAPSQPRPPVSPISAVPARLSSSPSNRYAPELERRPSQYSSRRLSVTGRSAGSRSSLGDIGPMIVTDDGFNERDYVMVDKNNIEVNALADEVAAGGISHNRNLSTPSFPNSLLQKTRFAFGTSGAKVAVPVAASRPAAGVIVAPSSTANHPTQFTAGLGSDQMRSASSPINPTRQLISTSPTTALQARSGTSSSSALAKAISLASMKLFGGSPPLGFPSRRLQQHQQQVILWSGSGTACEQAADQVEERAILRIEDLAKQSYAIFTFAETKVSQIVPSDSTTTDQSTGTESSPSPEPSLLTDKARKEIAEEAVSLFVKSLELLQTAMDVASTHWNSNQETRVASPRFNNAVQWIRERFNDCLEKAESAREFVQYDEDIPSLPAVAEVLIYDRALEMVCFSQYCTHVDIL